MLEGEASAITRAWDFQKEAGISDVPVPLEKYLSAANAELHVRNDLKEAEAGQTFAVGDRHIIVVNGRHSPERQRFTVLHELAHIRLALPSNHGRSISVDQLIRYNGRPREEILCDVFASECLLPRQFFLPDVRKRPCSFGSVEELAELYCSSLAATGSRFASYNENLPWRWILRHDSGASPLASHWRPTRRTPSGPNVAADFPDDADVIMTLQYHRWYSAQCLRLSRLERSTKNVP